MDIFPEYFMFELTQQEFEFLRSQIVTSKDGRGGTRYLPLVFTEHGVLQLSNVIRSGIAKQMSIRIIEVFLNGKFKLEISKSTFDLLLKKDDDVWLNIDGFSRENIEEMTSDKNVIKASITVSARRRVKGALF